MTSLQLLDTPRTPAEAERKPASGATWPVPPVALATLVDMGMSDEAIARYFGVDPAAVRAARTGAMA